MDFSGNPDKPTAPLELQEEPFSCGKIPLYGVRTTFLTNYCVIMSLSVGSAFSPRNNVPRGPRYAPADDPPLLPSYRRKGVKELLYIIHNAILLKIAIHATFVAILDKQILSFPKMFFLR